MVVMLNFATDTLAHASFVPSVPSKLGYQHDLIGS